MRQKLIISISLSVEEYKLIKDGENELLFSDIDLLEDFISKGFFIYIKGTKIRIKSKEYFKILDYLNNLNSGDKFYCSYEKNISDLILSFQITKKDSQIY